MKKIYYVSLFIATVLSVFALLASSGKRVLAANNTEIVTESEIARQPENTTPTNNWVLYTRNAGDGAFRNGPATPPLGIGSLELFTPTGADKVTLFNFDHIGTPLNTINAISYSTYRTVGSLQQVAALNIQVDVNGDADGGFTTLVFEPVYNTSQGAVQDGVWQNWNAYSGGNAVWWSSNPIPGAPNRDTFVSWNTIVNANPNAVIIGGFGVNQGSGNPNLRTAVDNLVLGYGEEGITYNFEQYRVATTREDCKVGGWQLYRRVDGTSFRNQGDCVSYISTNR